MEFSGKYSTLELQRLVELLGEVPSIHEEFAVESISHHVRNTTFIDVVQNKTDYEQFTLILDDRSQIHLNESLRIAIVP
jgi:hypothetical protein